MLNDFAAHSKNKQDKIHTLQDHLLGTAQLSVKLAKQNRNYPALQNIAGYNGVAHDVGKCTKTFDTSMRFTPENKSSRHPHAEIYSHLHKKLISQKKLITPSKKIFNLLALANMHHSGLKDFNVMLEELYLLKENPRISQNYIVEAVTNSLPFIMNYLESSPINSNQIQEEIPFLNMQTEDTESYLRFLILTKMLHGILCDSDYLDTQRHFDSDMFNSRFNTVYPMNQIINSFKTYQQKLIETANKSEVNDLRTLFSNICVEKGKTLSGSFFTLTAPTGFGKTLSALSFGFEHLQKHNLSGIIYVSPYIQITTQTASIYNQIFGAENVLESHSGLLNDSESFKAKIFGSDNFDFPLVITTQEQFFESIFSHRGSKLRKLPYYQNRLVILDEVQNTPYGCLQPVLKTMEILSKDYGMSFLMTTATQPNLQLRESFEIGIKEKITEIIPEPQKYFNKIKRVKYHKIPGKLSHKKIASIFSNNKQALLIADTIKDASAIHRECPDAIYLSSHFIKKDKIDKINEIKSLLKSGDPCLVISTQMIEAGVDLDFPVMYRTLGPLERIIQAAGRCNRHGKHTIGDFYIFELEESLWEKSQNMYGNCIGITRNLIKNNLNLESHDLIYSYFNEIYSNYNIVEISDINEIMNIIETYCGDIKERYPHKTLSSKFKMIQPQREIFVNCDPESQKLLEWFYNVKDYIPRKLKDCMLDYTVSLSESAYQQNTEKITEPIEGFFLWVGNYNKKDGLVLTNGEFEVMIA